MKVVIANCSPPVDATLDYQEFWARHEMPPKGERYSLFEQPVDWGFHLFSIGVHLMDLGATDHVEFWNFNERRRVVYQNNGILRIDFHNERDVDAYLERYGPPDLFVNHGRNGLGLLERFAGRCFRVHVPVLGHGAFKRNGHAECFLVDTEELLDEWSMLYVPVVNLTKFRPDGREKGRDFIYLASNYSGKRHDVLLRAVRDTELTGHLHPVDGSTLDLSGTRITTSNLNERSVVELLQTSRMAVYPADRASSPAAMWECVAAGLPIVVNEAIQGGKHLVVPGVTGEFATEETFADTIRYVLGRLDTYAPRQYFEEHFDTIPTIERFLTFFETMGWRH
jgi:hypothetical protein